MTVKNLISENELSTVIAEYIKSERSDESYQGEAQLEQEFIATLVDQGYERIVLKSENDLIANLRLQLEKLNNFTFTDNEWKCFFKQYIANANDGVVEKAKTIQEDYIKTIDLDNGSKKNIYLINKKNIFANNLQVFNQYTNESNVHKNIYDVTVLVNGLPLVHIELKRRGVNIREAFNQIDRYKRDSFWANSGLYECIQIFVISNGTYSKYYSNTTRQAHTLSVQKKKSNTFQFTSFWADRKNKCIFDLIDFAKTFFAKHTLLRILAKYCVFTSEERLLVMRPYQIVATEEILNKVEINHNIKNYGKKASGGYVWHTTGSGKTLTSFKTAQLAVEKEYVKKVLFVVDRKDLDYQTMKEYDRFEKGCANSNSSTKVLKTQLGNPNCKIIITTIQKLDRFIKKNKLHDVYSDEVVLIFDECHRSQFGNMHKAIIGKFKKYYIFGFTGTPIFAVNLPSGQYKTTEQVFGDKLHTYTIVDAIADKNVLRFRVEYWETVKPKEEIGDKKVKDIDREKALLSNDRITNNTNHIIENFAKQTKQKEGYGFSSLQNVIEVARSNKTEEQRRKVSVSGFNSILATASIDMAKAYYKKFSELEHNLKVALIYSYAPNEAEADGLDEENNEDANNLDNVSRDFLDNAIKDYNGMFGTAYDTSADKFQNYYKDVSLRMKNKEIDVLIVVNMFLTGFDAVTLNTLWVDKKLQHHGIIQAFSRTNRIFNDIKACGNIVCFRNLEEKLNSALELFGGGDVRGVVVMKTFDEYYNGYKDEENDFEGYRSLVAKLKIEFPLDVEMIGEKKKKQFINLFGAILRVRNILACFAQFANDTLLSPRELQDYHSTYIDIYNEFKSVGGKEKETINDDVVFEMELIKQIEVNVDYILELIKRYADSKFADKEILVSIGKSIDSSMELRNKKDLIMAFIATLNSGENTLEDFNDYIEKERHKALEKIIDDEHLKKRETREYIKKAFKDGKLEVHGVEISNILPPMSRFSQSGDRLIKKNKVIAILSEYFERFYTISSSEFDV